MDSASCIVCCVVLTSVSPLGHQPLQVYLLIPTLYHSSDILSNELKPIALFKNVVLLGPHFPRFPTPFPACAYSYTPQILKENQIVHPPRTHPLGKASAGLRAGKKL